MIMIFLSQKVSSIAEEKGLLFVSRFPLWRAVTLMLLVLGAIATSIHVSSKGKSTNYAFEIVSRDIKQGYGTSIMVRLVDERSGKLVPDATLFISRLDMSPDGMGEMSSQLEAKADMQPGYFLFTTDLTMQGGWAITLAAKIPGVTDPVQSRLVLQAL